MNRRTFLLGTAAGAAALSLGRSLLLPALAEGPAAGQPSTGVTTLSVVRSSIDVNGRAASVFGLQQADGKSGIRLRADDAFNVALRNETAEPTIVHWHGLSSRRRRDVRRELRRDCQAAYRKRARGTPLAVG